MMFLANNCIIELKPPKELNVLFHNTYRTGGEAVGLLLVLGNS